MPVPHAHFQGLGQSPLVNRTMLYISLLLWSGYINNAGNASVQHNEIIFLISGDSYGNSLANNLLHHQWPQITAVFKNLSHFWKLGRWIAHWVRDGRTCHSFCSRKTLNSLCTWKAKGILRKSQCAIYGCSITRTRWEMIILKTALGECNIARGSTRQAGEPEMFQRLLFILINVPSHPGVIANIYKEENWGRILSSLPY